MNSSNISSIFKILTFAVVLSLLLVLASAVASSACTLTYQQLNTAQRNYYWSCMEKDKCYDLLYSKQYAPYKDCSLACFQKACDFKSSIVGCQDPEGKDYFVKGTTLSSDYPNGQTDNCYTFDKGTPQEKTLLLEYTCNSGAVLVYYVDCAQTYGSNYGCEDGACKILNELPSVVAIPDKDLAEGQTLNFKVVAYDADNDPLTYEAQGMPSGATLNKQTGQFSFSPSFSFLNHQLYEFTKVFNMQFRASDGKHYSAWEDVKLTVKDVNQIPVLSAIGQKQGTEGQTLSFKISGTDADNDKVGYHAYWCPNYNNGNFGNCVFGSQYYPAGVTFSTTTGDFKWDIKAGQKGEYGVRFYAWEIYGGQDYEDVVIKVSAAAVPGCTNPAALNFNPAATVDDGSCILPQPATLTEHHITVEFGGKSQDRMYKVYEPSSCKSKECPLLFVFHALGQTAQNAIDTFGMQATADQNGFVVAFPESLTLEMKNYGLGIDPPGKHWDINALAFSSTQDTKFVEAMITKIDTDYDINLNKMFTTGMSYGGYFSYYVNFVLPDKFKAFCVHSAGLIPYTQFGFTVYWPATPLSAASVGNTPALIIFSSDDTLAPKLFADTFESQMKIAGHSPITKYDLVNQGHNWDKTKNQMQWDFLIANS